MKPTVNIEGWSLVADNADCYTPPENRVFCLHGRVYDHPRHNNGKVVTTSPIDKVDGDRVETRNTIYILGCPDQDYIEWCRKHKYHVPTREEPILLLDKTQNMGK